MRAITPFAGHARVVGLTGSPGVGKSTVTAALLGAYRALEFRVAVLPVDPTSPFTRGARVADMVRLQEQPIWPVGIFRSMGNLGHNGRMAWVAPEGARQ